MRYALLLAASLLAAGCGGNEVDDSRAGAGNGMAESDAAGAFADQPPTALGFTQASAMSDMYEIAAGKIALEKAESDEVRAFAQMMVADHTTSSKALQDAVATSGQTLAMPTELDAEHRAQVDILNSLQGAAFDREYLSQQMAAHRKALAILKAYAGNGDVAELRQFAQGTISVVQKHHDWLEANTPTPGAADAPTGTGGTPGATMN